MAIFTVYYYKFSKAALLNVQIILKIGGWLSLGSVMVTLSPISSVADLELTLIIVCKFCIVT